MNNCEWLMNMTYEQRGEWLEAEHVESNDAIGTESDVRPEMADANDSREKLEDDVGFIVKEGFVTYKSIIGWLDRQAAIIANETNYNNTYVGLVRGKQWERTEISDYYCGRCGWKVTDHDSYCPECGGALHKAPNKPDGKFDARKTAETPETDTAKGDIRDFDDSREKLEAEVQFIAAINEDDEKGRELFEKMIIGLLDRQAAITKNEVMVHYRDELSRRDKREKELRAVIDQQRVSSANIKDLLERTCEKLKKAEDEREIYRELFGEALDIGFGIVSLGDNVGEGR